MKIRELKTNLLVEVVLHNHYGTSKKHSASSKNGFLEYGARASIFAAVEAGSVLFPC